MRTVLKTVTLLTACLASVSCNPVMNETVNPASMASIQYPTEIRVPPALTPFYEIIEKASLEHGVDPHLVAAVISIESRFNPKARSPRGAVGLMQLMPKTAKFLGVTNRWDPEDNVRGGTKYLQQLLVQFKGNIPLALAAYNAGPTRVVKYGRVPNIKETKRYVALVMAAHIRIRQTATILGDLQVG